MLLLWEPSEVLDVFMPKYSLKFQHVNFGPCTHKDTIQSPELKYDLNI